MEEGEPTYWAKKGLKEARQEKTTVSHEKLKEELGI